VADTPLAPPAPLALETIGLSRGYRNRWALTGLNLRMATGSSLLVVGANGAGKTTLLRMLATTLAPTSGDLKIYGVRPSDDLLGVRRRLGLVSHRTHLYDDLTGTELLESQLQSPVSQRTPLGMPACLSGLAWRAAGRMSFGVSRPECASGCPSLASSYKTPRSCCSTNPTDS